MSDKAIQLIKDAIKDYQSEDGATVWGAMRDLLTDALHIVHESLPVTDFTERILLDEAYHAFKEEREQKELAKINAMPVKELPLLIGQDWEFDSCKDRMEERLKKE